MKRTFLLALFVVCGHVAGGQVPVMAQSTVPETDFQIWNEDVFALPVVSKTDSKGKTTDKLSLLFITSIRLGQNRLAPVDERVGGGFEVALNKYFSLSPTYVYVASQPGRGRKDFEHRVRFDVTYSQKFKHISIKDRNRLEYRIRNWRQDSVRYRNKFTFGVPVHRDKKELFTPYVADEVYYDFTATQWSRNDLLFGIQKKFSDRLNADFFYCWRHNTSGHPVNVHALGVNLRIKLK
jgi:hypothetical protein